MVMAKQEGGIYRSVWCLDQFRHAKKSSVWLLKRASA
jgi:hypothetical protein